MYFPQLNQVVAESKTIGEIQSQLDEIHTSDSMAQKQLDTKILSNSGYSVLNNLKFLALILCISRVFFHLTVF
jgi:hypothetical protein